MNNAQIYCLCLHNELLNKVKALNYIPVGLGSNKFSEEWTTDKTGVNISEKNPYYGEYSFHYWIWKNKIDYIADDIWIGFCAYRRFWGNKKNINSNIISEKVLNHIPDEWNNYDVILGEKIYVNRWKLSKILKKGFRKLTKNPFAFSKKNQNIKLHFDIFHGEGLLDQAIELLDKENKESFKDFVNKESAFNRENLFICKSKKLMNAYFESVFSWLVKCESIFGFNLHGYSKTRIYAFLAERYLSYWFQKNANVLEWPIFFFDTNRNRLNN